MFKFSGEVLEKRRSDEKKEQRFETKTRVSRRQEEGQSIVLHKRSEGVEAVSKIAL